MEMWFRWLEAVEPDGGWLDTATPHKHPLSSTRSFAASEIQPKAQFRNQSAKGIRKAKRPRRRQGTPITKAYETKPVDGFLQVIDTYEVIAMHRSAAAAEQRGLLSKFAEESKLIEEKARRIRRAFVA